MPGISTRATTLRGAGFVQADPHPSPQMRNLLILLAFFFVSLRTSALPSFDPFADATANGGTSYTVGSTLTNQFNPALFAPWYSRGGSFGSTTPLIVSGNLSYPGLPASTGNSEKD